MTFLKEMAKIGNTGDAVFPAKDEDFEEEGRQVVQRMVKCGLELKCFLSVQKDEVFALIRAPENVLAAYADKINYRMLLNEGALEEMAKRGSPEHGVNPIEINDDPNISERHPYQNIYGKYDTNPEMQHLYWRPEGCQSVFRPMLRLKLTYYILEASVSDGGCGLSLRVMKSKTKVIKGFFPLHDAEEVEGLQEKWLQKFQCSWNQPVYDVKEYLGEKIGLYFAFLGHYTTWCLPCGVIGLFLMIQTFAQANVDVGSVAVFALIASLWSVLMLEFWKRKEKRLALEWGMIGFEQEEKERPEFSGDRIKSFVDGKDILYFPKKDRTALLCESIGVVLSMVCVVLGCVAGIFILRYQLTEVQEGNGSWAPLVCSFINAFVIQFLNAVYQAMAYWLTDRENHRTDTAYEDSLIAKIFAFQFVNSYASFYYIAFIYVAVTGGICDSNGCMNALAINLAMIFGTRLTVGNLTELLVPRIMSAMRLKKETKGVEGAASGSVLLRQPELEYLLEPYDSIKGTLGDYAELAIQYGFVTLFVAALPATGLLAWISNYVEIRTDGHKLLKEMQRAIPAGAEDIGTWQSIFTIIANAAVVTNSALVCFTMTVFDVSPQGRVWLFIGFQYAVFGLLKLISDAIPDVPEDVTIQLERTSFLVSKLIDKVADENDDRLLAQMQGSNTHVAVEK